MRAVNFFTERATAAGERHLRLVTAFQGAYAETIAAPDRLSERAAGFLAARLFDLASLHNEDEAETLGADIAQSAGNARRDARAHLGITTADERADALDNDILALREHVGTELQLQIRRDIEQVMRKHREFRLKVSLQRHATGMDERAAEMAVLYADRWKRLTFADRAGRRWPSQRFVRTAWRQALVDAYLGAYLRAAAEHGEDHVLVFHPDRNHAHAFARIPLDDGGARLDEIRETVFHPNSEALPRVARFFEEAT